MARSATFEKRVIDHVISANGGQHQPGSDVYVFRSVENYGLETDEVQWEGHRLNVNASVWKAALREFRCNRQEIEQATALAGFGTGGAVALAVALMKNSPMKEETMTTVYTFASPPLGCTNINHLLLKKVSLYRYKMNGDPVSTQGFEFSHAAPPILIGAAASFYCLTRLLYRITAIFGNYRVGPFTLDAYSKELSHLTEYDDAFEVICPLSL